MAQSCDLTLTPVNFGAYNMFSAFPLNVTSAIDIACSEPATTYIVMLGPSQNSMGFRPRVMRPEVGMGTLTYNLYADAARTLIWGDGSAGTITRSATSNQAIQHYNVFGRISAGQTVVPGQYGDQIIVTVEW